MGNSNNNGDGAWRLDAGMVWTSSGTYSIGIRLLGSLPVGKNQKQNYG